MPKALIYSRVSTANQADEGTSLDSQVRECSLYAEANNYDIAHITKEVFSGAYLFDRPLLNEQRDKIRQNVYDAVIVYSIDRLSRDIAHLAIICDELERHNTKLLFVTENLDDTPEGKLLRSVKSYVAEVEREKIKERCVRGKKTKILQGKFVPASNLYGYSFNKETGKREIIESEAEIVREIYKEISKGVSLRSIAESLNDRNIPPSSVAKRVYKDARIPLWRLSALRRIVREPAYKGLTIAWRFKRVSGFKNGKRTTLTKLRDESEWVELPGITPAVVDSKLWEAVQQKLSDNHGEIKRNKQTPYLLRGLVFCGVCGKKMYPDKEDKTRRVYRCSSRSIENHQRCAAKRVNADKAENKIWQAIKLIIENPKQIETNLDKHYKAGGSKRKKIESNLEDARTKANKLKSEIETLVSRAATVDNSVWSLFEQQIKSKQSEREKLQILINELESKLTGETEKKLEIIDKVKNFREKVENAPFETKRLILESFNVKVFADGKNVDLYADFTF
jgi:site-specific DNA recombinase